MDEALDVRLPPWFAINNSALKRNSLKKILTIIEVIKLYSSQNGFGHVRMCPIHSTTACWLMVQSTIMELQDLSLPIEVSNKIWFKSSVI